MKPTLLIYLLTLLVPTLFANPISSVPEGGTWTRIPLKENQKFIFIAYEEAAFIREKIGDWLPFKIIEVEKDDKLLLRIPQFSRKEDSLELIVEIFNERTRQILSLKKVYSSNGTDGGVGAVVEVSTDRIVLAIQHDQNSIRRIVVSPSVSIKEMQSEFKISRAKVKWNWDKVKIFRFSDFTQSNK